MRTEKRWAVFSIKQNANGSVWVRAGGAQINRDGSMNITLDVLPLDGRLHVRQTLEKFSAPDPVPAAPLVAAEGRS